MDSVPLSNITNHVSWNSGFTAILIIFFGYIIYWLYKPWSTFKDLTRMGYEDIKRSNRGGDAYKRLAINEVNRRRKVGDIPPPYPNGWFVACQSEDLGKGEVKELYLLGMNLVVWRGEGGKSYIADAYCPHLGAHLGVGGKVRGECIECPFHGWNFNGPDGAVAKIPYCDQAPSQNIKLKMWQSLERNELIYLWFHAEKEEPTWFPPEIPQIKSGEWGYAGRLEYMVGAHIQDLQENGPDIVHLNAVHGDAAMAGSIPQNAFFKWEFFKHTAVAEWKKSEETGEKHVSLVNVDLGIALFDKSVPFKGSANAKIIGPGLLHIMLKTPLFVGMDVMSITPVEPLVQRFVIRFYSTLTPPLAKMILLAVPSQFERDVRIWNRKMYRKNPAITKVEAPIAAYRRWFAQFYTENSPRYYFSEDTTNTTDF